MCRCAEATHEKRTRMLFACEGWDQHGPTETAFNAGNYLHLTGFGRTVNLAYAGSCPYTSRSAVLGSQALDKSASEAAASRDGDASTSEKSRVLL